jgi:hypothetical protein
VHEDVFDVDQHAALGYAGIFGHGLTPRDRWSERAGPGVSRGLLPAANGFRAHDGRATEAVGGADGRGEPKVEGLLRKSAARTDLAPLILLPEKDGSMGGEIVGGG